MTFTHICPMCESNIEFVYWTDKSIVIDIDGPEECPECSRSIDHGAIAMSAQDQLAHTNPND